MLELRDYTGQEMSEILGTKSAQGMKRKLDRYGVSYQCDGRGKNLVFSILEITEPFKTFAITELGFDANTDFKKLAYFFYFFLNDDTFAAMPDEVKETWMENSGHKIARQTITKYTEKLQRKNLVYRNNANFIYYFAYHSHQTITDHATYVKAWKEYWERIKQGWPSGEAIFEMICDFGGVARKQGTIMFNGIYLKELEYLNQLACAEVCMDATGA